MIELEVPVEGVLAFLAAILDQERPSQLRLRLPGRRI
jgi:hypothetical protein